ncbi:hypothetical protein NSA28_04975 [Clostridium perfringens]|uniref:hypothetical protein n=1 Tax=Clostridium perfringens TaxID=1502 RepID=UPI0018D7FB48|nr:hypothetical protein [Clostridium perfringens]MCR1962971.1 hypothetical protein [Clostridium perfringens]QPR51814.1 hypothetical protein I6G88_02080 [Clostridium perfringens]
MAFENGDQIKNYLGACLEKYKDDKDIFNKALTMIEFYMKKVDWPYCIEDLDKVSTSLLGMPIIELTYGVGKYIDNEHMKWDCIPKDFKADYIFFYNCIGETYNQYWHGRYYPNRLNNLSYLKGTNDIYFLKFAKNNDEKLEVEMSEREIEYLIKNLGRILEDHRNE